MSRWRMLTSLVNGSWLMVNGYDARRSVDDTLQRGENLY